MIFLEGTLKVSGMKKSVSRTMTPTKQKTAITEMLRMLSIRRREGVNILHKHIAH